MQGLSSTLKDDIFYVKDSLTMKINEIFDKLITVECDNNTTRALVKGQNEYFTKMNY